MSHGAIAIVGASGRFPGAADLEAFWRLLVEGRDAISEITADRWSTRAFYHPTPGTPGKTYSWAAGLVDGVDQFDPGFFGISPREATEMDPRQRLLLELAWHALEDAGLPSRCLAGTATGVYIGASSTDYGDLRLGDPAGGGPHFVSGATLSILANRVSHVFDLRGPSQAIDTACSSSLVALHDACEALRAGRIEAALVGGINLLLSPYPFIGFAQAGMLSRRGRCFAFDARADGYVRGEGGGIVVLKPLEQALADGDPIRAVIRATAVSASGRTLGLSLPSEAAQAALLRDIYRDAGIAPEALAFIEMHGTGTPAGDPVEAAAVGRVLGQSRTTRLPIGSVKTNIGHLEPASGIAGLLKAMLALERRRLPRSLYGETPNPKISFEDLNLRLLCETEQIGADTEAYAGVNSFGFGGTNAHAILAAPPSRRRQELDAALPVPPLLISARSDASLRDLGKMWCETLAAMPRGHWPALFRAAARRRYQHAHRLAILGDDPAVAVGEFLAGASHPAAIAGTAARDGKLVFVYSGNGAQFAGMGADAYRASAALRAAIGQVDGALAPLLGWSVGERLAGGVDAEGLRRADIAQPMLFAIQVAITIVLRDRGVAPSGFVGHSVGEIAAAWAADALSLDDAARIITVRSRHQQRTHDAGRMAALALGEDDAKRLLAEMENGPEIAAVNSARSVTVAGTAQAVAALGDAATRRCIACRPLDLDFAFHSAAMEPIREDLLGELAGISSTAPVGDLVSTVTASRITTQALDATHWWRNVRDPVRFADAVQILVAGGYRVFAEIGPNPVLLRYLRDGLRGSESGQVVASLENRVTGNDPFPEIAARLHVVGHDMSGAPWLDGSDDPRGLPLYPWRRERFWFPQTVEAARHVDPPDEHPLLGFRQSGPVPCWVSHLDTVLFPFVADHRVGGMPVLPAAAFIEMALAAARDCHPDSAALVLRDVELRRPMAFEGTTAREVRCSVLSDDRCEIASRRRLADEPMTVHATARLGTAQHGRTMPGRKPAAGGCVVSGTALYRRATRVGLDYGDQFRTVREVATADDGTATVSLEPAIADTREYLIDPRLLDGALQGLLALHADEAHQSAAFLPRRFGRVCAYAPFGREPRTAELCLKRRGKRSAVADIALFDETGELIAELEECVLVRVDLARSSSDHFLRVDLVPAPLEPQSAPAVFDRLPEIVSRLAALLPRDPAGERDQALLLDALLAAIAVETAREMPQQEMALPEALRVSMARFDDADLPDSTALWRRMLADYPDMVAELAVAAVLREELPAMLHARRRVMDPGAAIVAALRQAAPPAVAAKAVIAAALDEIASAWPVGRPLRVREIGATRPSDRLAHHGGVRRVSEGEDCDLLVCAEAGAFGARLHEKLAPGGAVLAVMPLPNPLWELVSPLADWRAELELAGYRDIGSTPVALGPWPCAVVWARRPVQPQVEASSTKPSLSLIAEGLDPGFAAALVPAGFRVVLADTAADGIVFVPAPEGDPLAEASRLLLLLGDLAARAAEQRVPLWVMTSGAHRPAGEAGLSGAALCGFARTLRNETPGLVLRLVDVPPDMPWAERARVLAREMASPSVETDIVWTSAGRHVPRLRRGLPPIPANADDQIVASLSEPGLDRLGWERSPRAVPGAGEIEIEVRAAAVNFRDVMAATGMLPEEALTEGYAGAALGLECAGVVSAVGAGVDALAVGDRVAGFAAGAMASRVVARADAVMTIPEGIGFAAAATLPVAFVTARYSLETLARLGPGESVLIHAASGGVGLAAIQIAKGRGATVFATAGSAAKRAFLRLAGADHVCDSRELRFVEAVRAATEGVGVDVVLNSLHGEAMEESLELLKPFGRFVELGKRDFHENRRLRTRPLRRNVSYFAVDIDQLPQSRPELAKSLLEGVRADLVAGEIRPLAHRGFAFAEIADAFRLMQSAQHIGKLVLVPDGNAGIAVMPSAELSLLRRDGAYVVTGGLEGFGFAAARWLAEHGAGHLALIGRRGVATPGAAERIAELRDLGAVVGVHAADVADREQLAVALGRIRDQDVPIRGIVHAAAAIVDGLAASLSSADVETALRAKLGGALLLDRLTGGDPLDLFWLFSSATTLLGAPGQGAYVASNAALEALARRRHAEGKPALAIAWGAIADAGVLARQPGEREALAHRLGAAPLAAAKALSALPAMAASGLPVVAFADMRWREANDGLPILATPMFDELRGAVTETKADAALLARLSSADAAERRELLTGFVAGEAARVLRLSTADVEPHRPLVELGMDSLMAVELRLAIESRLHIDVPLMSLSEGVSAARLAVELDKMIDRALPDREITVLAARYEASPVSPEPAPLDLAAGE